MAEEKMIAIRLKPEQIQKLEQLAQMTGWNQSDIIRRLIDNAWVTPPAVGTTLDGKKAVALVSAL